MSAERPAPAGGWITWRTLAFMTVATTGSIAQLSASAEYGLGSVTLYLLPALLFLLPVALVAAELAGAWNGGAFAWVREALGEREGFQAIWLQWIQSVALYPSMLSFAAGSLAYAFRAPHLASNGLYTGSVILIVFWGATFVALRGLGATAKLSSRGMLVGTLIPAIALLVFMGFWIGTGKPSNTALDVADVVPPFTGLASIVLIVSNFLAFAGLEVQAVHIRSLKNPGRNYPKALALAGITIVSMYMLGSIAVSVAVPKQSLNLNAGAAQAFAIYSAGLGLPILGQVLAAMLVVGILAAAVSWVSGPSKGLLLVGREGFLPPRLQKTNDAGVQKPILIVQGIVVTILSMVFVFAPSVSTAFWMLQAMTALLYLTMYVMLFVSAVRLRTRRPDVVRTFRAPMIRLVAGVGIFSAVAAIIIALVPPAQFANESGVRYAGTLLAGAVILGVPPRIIYHYRKPAWVQAESLAEDAEEGLDPESELPGG